MNKSDQCTRGATDRRGIHQRGREDRATTNLRQNPIEGYSSWELLNHHGPENVVLARLWDKSQTPLEERIVADVHEEVVVRLPVTHGRQLLLLALKDAGLADDPSQPHWAGIRS